MCGFADAKLCAHCTSDHGRGSRNSNNNLSPGEILTEVRPIPQIPLSYKNKHERDFYHVVCFLRSFVQNEGGGGGTREGCGGRSKDWLCCRVPELVCDWEIRVEIM